MSAITSSQPIVNPLQEQIAMEEAGKKVLLSSLSAASVGIATLLSPQAALTGALIGSVVQFTTQDAEERETAQKRKTWNISINNDELLWCIVPTAIGLIVPSTLTSLCHATTGIAVGALACRELFPIVFRKT